VFGRYGVYNKQVQGKRAHLMLFFFFLEGVRPARFRIATWFP